MATWVVAASREGAKIFEAQKRTSMLKLITEYSNPQGKKLLRELGSDKPGRSSERGQGHHGSRHAYQTEVDPREHQLQLFLAMVADKLQQASVHNSFDRLILAAEPHVLGLLKRVLSDGVHKKITSTVSKDLYHNENSQLSPG